MSVLEIALYALFAVVIVIEILRLLTFRYFLKHQHKAPKGQFKITMSADQFEKQAAAGAFAVAITDTKGVVYMTLLVQKEAKK
jgi:hypothetical protein